ncbi:GATSL3 [Bugula neritina]|uniref:GATSL3 n=1 Tax=Bugula neritina TaxID=10212 RepID=A0A7J7J6I5_BUGNE|nr:GATSL3 [Bugula neritina]
MPIVLEEHRDELTVVDGVWIPLVVSVGLDGLNTAGISKIARSVIMPLADFNISVYCLSTYKTDYVLVRKSDLAYACRVLAYDFKITEEKSITSEEVYIDPSTIPPRQENKPLRPITNAYTSPGNTFYITSMDRSSIEPHALNIIECLFFSHTQPKGNESFFSLGIVDNDISLVLDDHLLHKFPAHILFNTREKWKMVKIGDMPGGLGFVTAGIVPCEDIDTVMKLLMERKLLSHEAVPDADMPGVLANQTEDFGDVNGKLVTAHSEEIDE